MREKKLLAREAVLVGSHLWLGKLSANRAIRKYKTLAAYSLWARTTIYRVKWLHKGARRRPNRPGRSSSKWSQKARNLQKGVRSWRITTLRSSRVTTRSIRPRGPTRTLSSWLQASTPSKVKCDPTASASSSRSKSSKSREAHPRNNHRISNSKPWILTLQTSLLAKNITAKTPQAWT